MVINNKKLQLPLIQGGMGVGVSLGNLAGNVAKCGCMGVISSVNIGYREKDFISNPKSANERAFREEIRKAHKISEGNGLIAVNIMVATNHYSDMVKVAVEEGVDAVISGAGLPINLPQFTNKTSTLAAPIVSSGKAAVLLCKSWDRKYETVPDFIVIEGSKAGGHLGFKREELDDGTVKSLDEILSQVLLAIAPYEKKYERKIPIFVAGGIFDGSEMAHFMRNGASGVQIGTRFIATYECDASLGYKKAIIDAKQKDVIIIKSPVGMPGRAINSPLIKNLSAGIKFPPDVCNSCLKVCSKGNKTLYCISRALIDAVNGNWETGLFFCGTNVGRVNKIVAVKELIDEIIDEWRSNQ